jgi:hypothetical protein
MTYCFVRFWVTFRHHHHALKKIFENARRQRPPFEDKITLPQPVCMHSIPSVFLSNATNKSRYILRGRHSQPHCAATAALATPGAVFDFAQGQPFFAATRLQLRPRKPSKGAAFPTGQFQSVICL